MSILQPRTSLFSKQRPKRREITIDELRPISATSFLFNFLEIVIKNRIDRYMDIGVIKKLKDTQHGFRPKLGTESQILKFFVDAKQIKNKQEVL